MALTTLDPNTALIVVDLQKDIVSLPTAHPVAGVSTSIGVESTARHAYELGLNVTLAVDAMTDMNLEAHTSSLVRIFPRLGETGMTREIIDLLGPHPRMRAPAMPMARTWTAL